jgi:RNA polymerase sigma-70 factor, ECF subfamily
VFRMPSPPAVSEAPPDAAGLAARAAQDAANVAAARSPDRAAFARLYARFGPVVHAALLARVRSAEAEDLTQDVFIAAWRRLEDLRNDGAFGGWVLAIARNSAAGEGRRCRPATALNDEIAAAPETRADREQAEVVLGAVRELPEAFRETLLMRLVAGLSGPEIAARTGMSHGSVRVNLHRGMAMLKEKLEALAKVGDWP